MCPEPVELDVLRYAPAHSRRLQKVAGQWVAYRWPLDKMLPALFFPDYDVRLEEARRRLRPLNDGSLED